MLKFLMDIKRNCINERTASVPFKGSRSEIALSLFREKKLFEVEHEGARPTCDNVGPQTIEFQGRSSRHTMVLDAKSVNDLCTMIDYAGECLVEYQADDAKLAPTLDRAKAASPIGR